MKKKLIIILSLLALCLVVYWFTNSKIKPNSELDQPAKNQANFFDSNNVLATDTVVKIIAQGFDRSDLTIKKGTRIVWVNDTSNYAWPASDPHPTHTGYSEFDPEEPLKPGQAWAFVFDKAGKWNFHDHLNPSHRGTIIVE